MDSATINPPGTGGHADKQARKKGRFMMKPEQTKRNCTNHSDKHVRKEIQEIAVLISAAIGQPTARQISSGL